MFKFFEPYDINAQKSATCLVSVQLFLKLPSVKNKKFLKSEKYERLFVFNELPENASKVRGRFVF